MPENGELLKSVVEVIVISVTVGGILWRGLKRMMDTKLTPMYKQMNAGFEKAGKERGKLGEKMDGFREELAENTRRIAVLCDRWRRNGWRERDG